MNGRGNEQREMKWEGWTGNGMDRKWKGQTGNGRDGHEMKGTDMK